MNSKKRGLGRGLDSLLDVKEQIDQAQEETVASPSELQQLPIDTIQPGRYQPRENIDDEKLEELAASIREQGLMQPIVVREIGESRYEIVAGERRWRASQLAGMIEIPALVRDIEDDTAIAMALIENIQREDLNPMEEARAMQRFKQEFGCTDQEVATAVGKSRSTVTNLLRLNQLHANVAQLLERGGLEMGHARALLSLDSKQQTWVAAEVIERRLSVRQTEELVRSFQAPKSPRTTPVERDPNIKDLEREISEKLGAKTHLAQKTNGKGQLIISYSSLDELDGILVQLRR